MTSLWLVLAAVLTALPVGARRGGARRGGARRGGARSGAARRAGVLGGGSRQLSPRGLSVLASGGSFALSVGLIGGIRGLVVAVVAGAVTWRVAPLLVSHRPMLGAAELRRVPLLLDLVASVLRTGQPVEVALLAASGAAGPRLGAELAEVSGLLRLGAAPADAWSRIAADPRLRPVAVVAIRSADSGIRLASGWSALATELRAEAVSAATARAAAAGTWVMAPLGLCFLPAFVCLGIAPVVVGIASGLIGGGTL